MDPGTEIVFKCYPCKRKMQGTLAELREHVEKIHRGFDGLHEADQVMKVSDKYLTLGKYLVKVTTTSRSGEGEKKLRRRRCPFCGCVVEKSHLLNHVVSIHDKVCPKCPTIKSLTHEDFVKHCASRGHKGKLKFICSSCRFTTYLLSTFWEHRKQKHRSQLSNLGRASANTNRKENDSQLQNATSEAATTARWHSCPFTPCNYKHLKEVKLKFHVHSVHDPSCPHCQHYAGNDIARHLRRSHKDQKSLYICHGCKIVSSNGADYWHHRLQAHADKIKLQPTQNNQEPLKCLFCHCTKPDLKTLFNHVHSQHDPCCSQCHFVDRHGGDSMKRHIANYRHQWDDISKVRCSVWGCQRHFSTFHSYWQHRLQYHPEAMKRVKNQQRRVKFVANKLVYKKKPGLVHVVNSFSKVTV